MKKALFGPALVPNVAQIEMTQLRPSYSPTKQMYLTALLFYRPRLATFLLRSIKRNDYNMAAIASKLILMIFHLSLSPITKSPNKNLPLFQTQLSQTQPAQGKPSWVQIGLFCWVNLACIVETHECH